MNRKDLINISCVTKIQQCVSVFYPHSRYSNNKLLRRFKPDTTALTKCYHTYRANARQQGEGRRKSHKFLLYPINHHHLGVNTTTFNIFRIFRCFFFTSSTNTEYFLFFLFKHTSDMAKNGELSVDVSLLCLEGLCAGGSFLELAHKRQNFTGLWLVGKQCSPKVARLCRNIHTGFSLLPFWMCSKF